MNTRIQYKTYSVCGRHLANKQYTNTGIFRYDILETYLYIIILYILYYIIYYIILLYYIYIYM